MSSAFEHRPRQRSRPIAASNLQLVYFSPVPWASYAQRPHFMVRQLLADGVSRVLWVEPYPARLPNAGDWRRLRRTRTGAASSAAQGSARQEDARVEVLHVPALPIEPLPLGGRINQWLMWRKVQTRLTQFAAGGRTAVGVGRPCELALRAVRNLPAAHTFYDAMDDFPQFYGGWSRRSMTRTEQQLAGEVDLLVASATKLVEKFASRGLPATLIANGYPMRQLATYLGRNRDARALGYVGTMGPWFDWPMLMELARCVPDRPVRLVGPIVGKCPRNLPANVELCGPCSQDAVAAHVRKFAVGLIPFRRNVLTESVDPIKYYEYRAWGLPVLSTRFGQMREHSQSEGVFLVDDGCAVADVLARAVAWRNEAGQVESFRAAHDWSERFSLAKLWPEAISAAHSPAPVGAISSR